MQAKELRVGLLVLGLIVALSFPAVAAEFHGGVGYNPPPQGILILLLLMLLRSAVIEAWSNSPWAYTIGEPEIG